MRLPGGFNLWFEAEGNAKNKLASGSESVFIGSMKQVGDRVWRESSNRRQRRRFARLLERQTMAAAAETAKIAKEFCRHLCNGTDGEGP